jgi:hypothetical protein
MTQRIQILKAVGAGHSTVDAVARALGGKTALLSTQLCILRRMGFLTLVGKVQQPDSFQRPKSVYRLTRAGRHAERRGYMFATVRPQRTVVVLAPVLAPPAPVEVLRKLPPAPRAPIIRQYWVAGELKTYEVAWNGC